MRFLVDAQLPARLAIWLNEAGHDALHTLDLPGKNLTTDDEIVERARLDGRVVVSKDDDFVQSFLLRGEPALLLVSTGNMTNAALEMLIRANLRQIEAALASSRFVELTRDSLVCHD